MEEVKKLLTGDLLDSLFDYYTITIKLEAELIDIPSMDDIVLRWKSYIWKSYIKYNSGGNKYKILSANELESKTINQLEREGFKITKKYSKGMVTARISLSKLRNNIDKYKCGPFIKQNIYFDFKFVAVKNKTQEITHSSYGGMTIGQNNATCTFWVFRIGLPWGIPYECPTVTANCTSEDLVNLGFEYRSDLDFKSGKNVYIKSVRL